MGERDDELGLGLSLSLGLGCVGGGGGGYGGHEKKQQQPALKLNEMPFPANNHLMPRNTPRKSSWNDLSQYPSDGSANTRSFWKGLDMNQVPRVTECEVDETTRVSSPNSTISSISGKRSEREPINEEAEADAERASCSRVSDEEDGSGDASRKKLRLSKEQSLLLEEAFKEHNTLNPKQKLALAKQLNLQPRQVEVWFQNRRARSKLKQTEVDCEYLKRCCKNLTEENRRLQKEVQELRALKLSPQLYMHMNPPTTLTMCPSCERVAVSSSSAVSSSAAASSSLASSGQSRLPMGPNHQGPVAINPWAAMPVPHRPFSGSTTRS